jgi:pimeloyl-ACP methyl ester carboxylesterase
MKIINEHTDAGVLARHFELEVNGAQVPGVVWTPAAASGSRPLILLGHGGGQHKGALPVVATATRYVNALGYAVAAIDAPDHGTRLPPAEAERFATEERERIQRVGLRGEVLEGMRRRARQAAAEWRTVLDGLQTLAGVGADHGVAFQGVSFGGMVGIPLMADDQRIIAGVLGLVGAESEGDALATAARRISAPLTFVAQWDDEFISRAASLALFDAFGSKEKTLHVNPGGHLTVPAFERSSWEPFYRRHLGQTL